MLLVCPSPITSNCPLGKEVTVHSRDLCSPLRAEQIHHLEFSTGNLPIIPLLFVGSIIYIRIDLWIFVLYFKLSSNNSLFCCSHCSRFGLWKLFQLVPVSICHISIFLFFYLSYLHLSLLLFVYTSFCTTKCYRLILCISCPGPKINHFSKENVRGKFKSQQTCCVAGK